MIIMPSLPALAGGAGAWDEAGSSPSPDPDELRTPSRYYTWGLNMAPVNFHQSYSLIIIIITGQLDFISVSFYLCMLAASAQIRK